MPKSVSHTWSAAERVVVAEKIPRVCNMRGLWKAVDDCDRRCVRAVALMAGRDACAPGSAPPFPGLGQIISRSQSVRDAVAIAGIAATIRIAGKVTQPILVRL
jgi:hypothetical protein